MPHKDHAATGSERPVGDAVPAAIGVPVHVAGVDAAIGVNAFYDGDVAVAARTLHIRLQDDDGRHVWRAGDDPAGGGSCSVVPLVGVANPVYIMAGQREVAHVGPEGALAVRETVGCDAGAGEERSSIVIA